MRRAENRWAALRRALTFSQALEDPWLSEVSERDSNEQNFVFNNQFESNRRSAYSQQFEFIFNFLLKINLLELGSNTMGNNGPIVGFGARYKNHISLRGDSGRCSNLSSSQDGRAQSDRNAQASTTPPVDRFWCRPLFLFALLTSGYLGGKLMFGAYLLYEKDRILSDLQGNLLVNGMTRQVQPVATTTTTSNCVTRGDFLAALSTSEPSEQLDEKDNRTLLATKSWLDRLNKPRNHDHPKDEANNGKAGQLGRFIDLKRFIEQVGVLYRWLPGVGPLTLFIVGSGSCILFLLPFFCLNLKREFRSDCLGYMFDPRSECARLRDEINNIIDSLVPPGSVLLVPQIEQANGAPMNLHQVTGPNHDGGRVDSRLVDTVSPAFLECHSAAANKDCTRPNQANFSLSRSQLELQITDSKLVGPQTRSRHLKSAAATRQFVHLLGDIRLRESVKPIFMAPAWHRDLLCFASSMATLFILCAGLMPLITESTMIITDLLLMAHRRWNLIACPQVVDQLFSSPNNAAPATIPSNDSSVKQPAKAEEGVLVIKLGELAVSQSDREAYLQISGTAPNLGAPASIWNLVQAAVRVEAKHYFNWRTLLSLLELNACSAQLCVCSTVWTCVYVLGYWQKCAWLEQISQQVKWCLQTQILLQRNRQPTVCDTNQSDHKSTRTRTRTRSATTTTKKKQEGREAQQLVERLLSERLTISLINFELFRRQHKSFHQLIHFWALAAAAFSGASLVACYFIARNVNLTMQVPLIFSTFAVFAFVNLLLLLSSHLTKSIEKLMRLVVRMIANSCDNRLPSSSLLCSSSSSSSSQLRRPIYVCNSQLSMEDATCNYSAKTFAGRRRRNNSSTSDHWFEYPIDLWRRQILADNDVRKFSALNLVSIEISYEKTIAINLYLLGVWMIVWHAF